MRLTAYRSSYATVAANRSRALLLACPARKMGLSGGNGVLDALLFDIPNTTERLDPSIATTARAAAVSKRSAVRCLANLGAAGGAQVAQVGAVRVAGG